MTKSCRRADAWGSAGAASRDQPGDVLRWLGRHPWARDGRYDLSAMHLERWTIDEIFDEDVRVLRAGLRADSLPRAAVEAAMSSPQMRLGRGRPRRRAALATRHVVMNVEAAPVAAWTPEIEAMADRTRLTAFLLGGARR